MADPVDSPGAAVPAPVQRAPATSADMGEMVATVSAGPRAGPDRSRAVSGQTNCSDKTRRRVRLEVDVAVYGHDSGTVSKASHTSGRTNRPSTTSKGSQGTLGREMKDLSAQERITKVCSQLRDTVFTMMSSPSGNTAASEKSPVTRTATSESLRSAQSSWAVEEYHHRRRDHLANAWAVDKQQAIRLATVGQELLKHSDEEAPGPLRYIRRRWLNLVRKPRRFWFVVVPGTTWWLGELRWDTSAERAVSKEAANRVLLSDVRYATAAVLNDADAVEAEGKREAHSQSRDFRVITAERVLRLRAPDRESMKSWVVALVQLAREAQGSAIRRYRHLADRAFTKHTRQLFGSPDMDPSGVITLQELGELLHRMNIGARVEHVQEVFAEFDADKSGGLDIEEFSQFLQTLAVKDALTPWFQKYAEEKGEGGMAAALTTEPDDANAEDQRQTASEAEQEEDATQVPGGGVEGQPPGLMGEEQFTRFLHMEQGEEGFFSSHQGVRGSRELFARLEPPFVVKAKGRRFLTMAGFSKLMSCAENSIFDPARRARVYQDMSQPLSRYWIASSHNTYLEDDQLVGESSVSQYIEVLLRGCRCVEIDCWDGEDGEPIVTHGYTATARLKFADVVRAIRDYGFAASPYPLILSLEVHCSAGQRARMGQILQDLLEDRLLLPADAAEQLVSPEGAKHKILVKGKIARRTSDSSPSAHEDLASAGEETSTAAPRPSSFSTPGRRSRRWFGRSFRSSARWSTTSIGQGQLRAPSDFDAVPSVQSRAVSELRVSDLSRNSLVGDLATAASSSFQDAPGPLERCIYMRTQKLPKDSSLKEGESEMARCGCVSFDEVKALAMVDKHGLGDVRLHHRAFLSRAYPKATRINSWNYDPMPMWLSGFQMVALNYQRADMPMILNEGLFGHENGGSGYVLKPPRVCGHDGEVLATYCIMELAILSAHSLPKPPGAADGYIHNPKVRISIHGCAQDRATCETRRIKDNGFNPRWDERFFFELTQPDVALLALEVVSARPGRVDTVATAAFPLSGVREGVRWAALRDWRQQPIELCGLLLEVRIRGPWKEARSKKSAVAAAIGRELTMRISAGVGGLQSCGAAGLIDFHAMGRVASTSGVDSWDFGDQDLNPRVPQEEPRANTARACWHGPGTDVSRLNLPSPGNSPQESDDELSGEVSM